MASGAGRTKRPGRLRVCRAGPLLQRGAGRRPVKKGHRRNERLQCVVRRGDRHQGRQRVLQRQAVQPAQGGAGRQRAAADRLAVGQRLGQLPQFARQGQRHRAPEPFARRVFCRRPEPGPAQADPVAAVIDGEVPQLCGKRPLGIRWRAVCDRQPARE